MDKNHKIRSLNRIFFDKLVQKATPGIPAFQKKNLYVNYVDGLKEGIKNFSKAEKERFFDHHFDFLYKNKFLSMDMDNMELGIHLTAKASELNALDAVINLYATNVSFIDLEKIEIFESCLKDLRSHVFYDYECVKHVQDFVLSSRGPKLNLLLANNALLIFEYFEKLLKRTEKFYVIEPFDGCFRSSKRQELVATSIKLTTITLNLLGKRIDQRNTERLIAKIKKLPKEFRNVNNLNKFRHFFYWKNTEYFSSTDTIKLLKEKNLFSENTDFY
jgi:hypothetical protein